MDETAPDSRTHAHESVIDRIEAHRRDGTPRYEIKDEIARGGMGVIREVWDGDLRRRLAMKSVLQELGGGESERMLARFFEEAQITGQLDHPGVVPVHELGIDAEGHAFFTMPLVHGREFAEIIRLVHAQQEGWNLQRALRVMLQICEAVAYAHQKPA